MPKIQLPDGNQLDFPDNPTAEDKQFLSDVFAKFDGAKKPKGKTTWGEDFSLALDQTADNVFSGTDYIAKKLGANAEGIDNSAMFRREAIAKKREQTLQGKEQGFFGGLIPSLAVGIGSIAAAPLHALGKGLNRTEDLQKDGVDKGTAEAGGWLAGGLDAAQYALPVAKAGGAAVRAITGGMYGLTTAVVDPWGTQALLNNEGYQEQAKKFTIEPKDLATGAGIGALAGAVFGRRGKLALDKSKETADLSKEIEIMAGKTPESATTPTSDGSVGSILDQIKAAQKAEADLKKTTKGPLKTGNQLRESFNPEEKVLSPLDKLKQAQQDSLDVQKTTKGPLKTGDQLREILNKESPRETVPLNGPALLENNPTLAADKPSSYVDYNQIAKDKLERQYLEGATARKEKAYQEHLAQIQKEIEANTTKLLERRYTNKDKNDVEASRQAELEAQGQADALYRERDRVTAEREAHMKQWTEDQQMKQATQGIDGQESLGAQYGGKRSPFADELEGLNTPQRPANLSPEMTARFGTEEPSGVVNPKALEAVNRKYGDGGPLTQEQHAAYGGELASTGIVNPKSIDAMHRDQPPLTLFGEDLSPPPSPEALAFHKAIADANKAADAATAPPVPTRKLGGVGKRGRNQGGAIDFGALLPGGKKKPVERTDPTLSSGDEASALSALPKVKGPLDNFLLNRPYDGPGGIIETAKASKDDPHSYTLSRPFRPGGAIAAISKRDPILGKAVSIVKGATNAPENFIKKYVTGESYVKGLDSLSRLKEKLPKEDFTQAMQLIVKADQMGVQLTPQFLAKLTPEQEAFITQYRTAFDALHVMGDNTSPLTKRSGYFPSINDNTYSSLVFKKNSKGEWETAAIVGGDTKITHNQRAAKYKNDPNYKVEQIPSKTLNGTLSPFEARLGMTKYLEAIAARDPALAKEIQATLDIEASQQSALLYGMNKHAMPKKGIPGFAGNKEWRTPEQNAQDAYKASVQYMRDAAHYYTYKKLKDEFFEKIVHNPELATQKAKSIDESLRYFKNHEGELGNIGRAGNAALQYITDTLGIAPKHVIHPLSSIKKGESQLLLGATNINFLTQQAAQIVTSHLPFLELSRGRLGASFADANAVAAKQGFVTGAYLIEHFSGAKAKAGDAFDRAAWQYAKDNQLVSFSEMEHIITGQESKAVRIKDNVLGAIPKIGEIATRPYVFMTHARMVKEFSKGFYTDAEAFDIAKNFTQPSMISYEKAERPYLWNQMGVIGQFAGGFKTYAHGVVGQQGLLIKEAYHKSPETDKRNAKPAVVMGATMLAMHGLLAMPGTNEANDVIAAVTEEFGGKRISIKDLIATNVGLPAAVGLIAYNTGLALYTKYGSPDLVPDMDAKKPIASVAKLAAGAQLSKAGEQTTAAYQAIASGGSSQEVKNLILSFTPPQHIQAVKEKLYKDEDGFLLNKYGQRDSYRTPKEWGDSSLTGVAPLPENLDKMVRRERKLALKALDEKRTGIEEQMFRLSLNKGNYNEYRWNKLVDEYMASNGTPEDLNKNLLNLHTRAKMTSKQRDEGINPNTTAKQLRYQGYQNPP